MVRVCPSGGHHHHYREEEQRTHPAKQTSVIIGGDQETVYMHTKEHLSGALQGKGIRKEAISFIYNQHVFCSNVANTFLYIGTGSCMNAMNLVIRNSLSEIYLTLTLRIRSTINDK